MKLLPVVLLMLTPALAGAQPAKVLVVYNTLSADSKSVADYYVARRGIPAANRCPVTLAEKEDVNYATFVAKIKTPVQACLNALGRANILYIVLTYETPFRVYDGAHFTTGGAARAVDSLLALPWLATDTSQYGNPYQAGDQSGANIYADFQTLEEWRAAHPAYTLPYLVWRLDGPTPAIAKAQVDRALAAERTGLKGAGCFDARYDLPQPFADSGYLAGDWDILRAWQLAIAAGFTTVVDRNDVEFGYTPAPLRCDDAALYVGWYSGTYNNVFTWAPGAIGWHLDSSSLLSPRAPNSWGGGAIANGITITSGSLAEPYLNAIPHYDTFLRSIFQGADVGNAMGRATETYAWMVVNVGDPLYRPFPSGKPTTIATALPPTPPAVALPPLVVTNAATFVRTDTTTKGNWKTAYGKEGTLLAETNAPTLPPMLRLRFLNASRIVWEATTTDVRALQKDIGADRAAAAWYGSGLTDWELDFFDGQTHQVAMYVVDWEREGRAQKVDLLDWTTGAVLDTRTVKDFGNGQYLIWNVTGHLRINITRTGGPSGVVSGWFVDQRP